MLDGVPPVSAVLVIVRFGGPTSSTLAHCSLAPVAETHAVSLTLPASRSACVTVCVPVHVIDLPGASVVGTAGEQLKPSSAGSSSTETLLSVTLPVLVATIDWKSVVSALRMVAGVADSV